MLSGLDCCPAAPYIDKSSEYGLAGSSYRWSVSVG